MCKGRRLPNMSEPRILCRAAAAGLLCFSAAAASHAAGAQEVADAVPDQDGEHAEGEEGEEEIIFQGTRTRRREQY